MKILIADSGSTKTDWCFIDSTKGIKQTAKTQGINPFYMTDEGIEAVLRNELLTAIPDAAKVDGVYFYGAGLRPEMVGRMTKLLDDVFGANVVEAANDLLGAARALFQQQEGIACILGTGSNSGLYNGKHIVANTPPMGFILGDEGSGAVLGKLFLGALCKGLLPEGLLEDFLNQTHQTVADIIDAVYRKPLPNRYLAGVAPFIHSHLDVPEVEKIVVDNFRNFFQRNLSQYRRHDLQVRAVGSIAYHFKAQFEMAARQEGFNSEIITEKSPLAGLVDYHVNVL